MHVPRTLVAVEMDDAAQYRQRLARLRRPLDAVEALPRAAQRKKVSDHTEGEVVRDEVRARKQDEHARRDEEQRIDRQPEAVAIEIAAKLPAKERHRLRSFEVGGVIQTRSGLAAKMPEQPLFRDAL